VFGLIPNVLYPLGRKKRGKTVKSGQEIFGSGSAGIGSRRSLGAAVPLTTAGKRHCRKAWMRVNWVLDRGLDSRGIQDPPYSPFANSQTARNLPVAVALSP
jgi:hypothetical protein